GIPAGAKEPQTVANDASAEGCLVGLVDRVGIVEGLQRTLLGPVVVLQRIAERAAEFVTTRLGDGVDDATGEPAVLGRDAGRLNRGLLDRILDEEVVRLATEVLVDDRAVDEEQVVGGKR